MKNFLVVLAFLITGCARNGEIHHGYTFQDVSGLNSRIQDLKVKKSTKEEVIKLLGSPTFLEKNSSAESFFYVEDLFKNGTIIKEKKDYSKVLRIDFYKERVRDANIYHVHQQSIFDDSLKTQVKANELTIVEQMQKNFTTINSISYRE